MSENPYDTAFGEQGLHDAWDRGRASGHDAGYAAGLAASAAEVRELQEAEAEIAALTKAARDLVGALPRCTHCNRDNPATSADDDGFWSCCDDCRKDDDELCEEEVEHAVALRTLIALLGCIREAQNMPLLPHGPQIKVDVQR